MRNNMNDCYTGLPQDLWPKGPTPNGTNRILPPAYNMGVAFYLSKSWQPFSVVLSAIPALIVRSDFAWPYVIFNASAQGTFFIGPNADVTIVSGFPVNAGQMMSAIIGDQVEVWGVIAGPGTFTVNVLKL